MSNLPVNGNQALAIAESMRYSRERVQIANPGMAFNSIRSYFTSVVQTIDRVLATATREATYCNYNPAECRSIA